jgi:hypothetical protein
MMPTSTPRTEISQNIGALEQCPQEHKMHNVGSYSSTSTANSSTTTDAEYRKKLGDIKPSYSIQMGAHRSDNSISDLREATSKPAFYTVNCSTPTCHQQDINPSNQASWRIGNHGDQLMEIAPAQAERNARETIPPFRQRRDVTDSPLALKDDTSKDRSHPRKKKSFLESLRDFSNSEAGRRKMEHLLDAITMKIHQAHPIEYMNDKNVKPTLSEKDFIKSICQDSWRPLVSCINRSLQNVKNKHRSEVLKDVKTNFETSHDPLFQAKQKEVRIAQTIQLAVSSAFVVAGAAVAIIGTGASFGLGAPVATALGGALSLAGLAVGAYIGQIVFPALWANRKTKSEPDAEDTANSIGKQIGLRRLPLSSSNIEGTIEYLSRSRVHKLEEAAKEISDELKHFILQWHTLRTGGKWTHTPSDLVLPLKACALQAAKNNPLSNAPEWHYFEAALLKHVDARIEQLNELKHGVDVISQWISDPEDTLKNQIAQDVWAAWLVEKGAFLINNHKPLPIGEPIAKALESCSILYDERKPGERAHALRDQLPRSAVHYSHEDIVFNPQYSLLQLITRQLRASFSRNGKRPPIRLTKIQKAQAAHVRKNQVQLINWAREHMVHVPDDSPAEQRRLLTLRTEYDMRSGALLDAEQNKDSKLNRDALVQEADQALLTLLHERIVSRNFDHFVRKHCPTLSQEVIRKRNQEGDSIFAHRALLNATAPDQDSCSEHSDDEETPLLQFA